MRKEDSYPQPDSEILSQPQDIEEEHATLKKAAIAATLFNLGVTTITLANQKLAATAQHLNSFAMELVDTGMPMLFYAADRLQDKGRSKLAMAARSVANIAHIGAASFGIAGALYYLNNTEDDPSTVNTAVSVAIGLGNLAIFNHLKSTEDEENHLKQRNKENFMACLLTNTLEAVPAIFGRASQHFFERGNIALVLAANAGIIAINGLQLVKDARLIRHLGTPESVDSTA